MSQQAVPPISIRHYQAMCALALVAIFLVQMEQNLPMLQNALIVVLGSICIMFRARLSPLIMFMAMAVSHLVEQYKQNQYFVPDARSAGFLDVTNVLLCLATLTYLVSQYRLNGLRFNVLPYDPRQEPLSVGQAFRPERQAGKPDLRASGESPQARTEQSLTPAELMWLAVPLPLFVLAAEVFAFVLRQPWNLVGYPPRWKQFLAITWLLVVVMFAVAHLFRHWKRLQMDRARALLLLQDVLWHETRGEQRRINRWIAWRKVKQREET